MTSGSGWRAAVVPARDDGSSPLPRGTARVVGGVLHLAFAAVVAVALVEALDGDRPLLVAALAVWALSYLLAGAWAAVDAGGLRAAGFLAVHVAVVAVLAWQQPSLLFVMWVAYPLVWFVTGTLPAGVLWTLVLAAAATAGPLVAWTRGDEPLWGPGETLLGAALSLLMGLWVHRLLTLSVQRDQLIAELQATRDELAVAHHERGVAAERERWAREVHDTLAQGYTSIVVLAQTVAAQLPADPLAAAERVALIEEVARENLGEARAMVAAFAPVALDSSTLVEALQRLAERFGRETGLATRLDTSALGDGGGLSRAEEIVLLRGAQEALANVRRHASATAVVLRVSRVGTGASAQVSVHVEDDGVGFDAAAAPGVGLAGLRDRAAQVGGAVDVVSAPGEGTRVTVRVPVR
ncbi:Two component signal transduction histidine kinase involved in sensing cell wall stress response [Modestobacter italicus]|uniref:Oxygen sensor histidine kinase NreB n=1 Tax=Modestobacter italicus (strain DSM 44449 / CECT 9708 / BC 501) TaxID=2732864 RepID=I4ET09_MODI5|nr:Two component signal transduction histidine kinase involved in sensing cell wall stress response [Modestobacter marinus]